MSDHLLDQVDPRTPASDIANNSVRIRKRDKFSEFWGFKSNSKEIKTNASTQSLNSRPQSQQSTRPPSVVSQASNFSADSQAISSSITMQGKPLPPLPPTEV
ncbi:hypothetical protein EC957_003750, partial [Mortierella hygrophila]